MRLQAFTFAVWILALPAVVAASPVAKGANEADKPKAAACKPDDKPIDYKRKADLPTGVVEALGLPMAEVGEPFQATDVILKKGLPFQRFLSARQEGCRMKVDFERGGIALRHESVDLELADGKWTVRKP